MNILRNRGIKLLVFDMAGTVIQEHGIVYNAIENSLNKVNCSTNSMDKSEWFGRSKNEVIWNMLKKKYDNTIIHEKYNETKQNLNKELYREYFDNNKLSLMHPDIPENFNLLREKGIKITLNTGYSRNLQRDIIEHFNLNECIDSAISSDEVAKGRPYPYMIYKLMEHTKISNIQQVAKIGDTLIDIEEGKNAGCGMTIAVMPNITHIFTIPKSIPDLVINNINDLIKQ
jgi:phosphonatase-like hydrolase